MTFAVTIFQGRESPRSRSFENSGIVFVANGLNSWMKLCLRQRADVMPLYCCCTAMKKRPFPQPKWNFTGPSKFKFLLKRYNGRKLLFLSRLLCLVAEEKSKRWRNECSPQKPLKKSKRNEKPHQSLWVNVEGLESAKHLNKKIIKKEEFAFLIDVISIAEPFLPVANDGCFQPTLAEWSCCADGVGVKSFTSNEKRSSNTRWSRRRQP